MFRTHSIKIVNTGPRELLGFGRAALNIAVSNAAAKMNSTKKSPVILIEDGTLNLLKKCSYPSAWSDLDCSFCGSGAVGLDASGFVSLTSGAVAA